jgi:hypothetical protein
MTRRALATALLALAFTPVAPAQLMQPPGWRPPAVVDYALASRTLQSAADWRQREDAAARLGGSGDPRWVGTLARAAAGDPSLRVRQAARDAIDSIREANGSPDPGLQGPVFPQPVVPQPILPQPANPWGGGVLPGEPYADMIDSWYRQYLRRSVDRGGLASRVALLRRGADPQDVEADIIASGEYWERNGSNVIGFVRGMYVDTLGHEPGRDEARYWVERYAINRDNRSAVAREFLQAAARQQLDRRLP